MRFTNAQYLEKEVVTISCRNNNSSAAIVDGQPVYFQDYNNASNFGVDVQNYSSNAYDGYFAGIAKWSKLAGSSSTISGAQVGDVFEAVAYGFTDAIVTLRTRAASTDSWASVASVAAHQQLIGETVGNGFTVAGPIPQTIGSAGTNLAAPVKVVLVESKASIASAASTYGSSNLADTYRMKVLVKAMG